MDQPHQYNLLHRAEIGHCGSCLNVLYDVVFFQQLVRALPRDILISAATKELLGCRCQDHGEDILRVILVRWLTINIGKENGRQRKLQYILY